MRLQKQKKNKSGESANHGGKRQNAIEQLLQYVAAVCCVGEGTADVLTAILNGGCFHSVFLLGFVIFYDPRITHNKSNKTDLNMNLGKYFLSCILLANMV